MNILFVANDPPGQAVYRYRCEHIAEVLRARGHLADVVYVGQARATVDHDVVVLHRICANAQGKRFAAAARACGAALVYSTDDLVFDEAALRDDKRIPKRWADFAPLHRKMLCEADAVIVSTDFLKAEAQKIAPGKPVYVIRNFLSPEMLRLSEAARNAPRPLSSGRITLGYLSGSATHDGDLAFIAEPLRDTLREWEEADLLLVGPVRVPPELAEFEGTPRLRRHAFVDWRELPALLATLDIALAPLEPGRPLNNGKSEIKALEAAAVGVLSLASRRGGFGETPPSFALSCALDSGVQGWRGRFQGLKEKKTREGLANGAREVLKTFGTFAQWEEPVERIFAEIAAPPRPRPSSPAPQIVDQTLSPKYLAKAALKWFGKK